MCLIHRLLFVFVTMANTFFERSLIGTCEPQPGILPIIPDLKPKVLPISSVPPCSGCEESFLAEEFLNAVQNTRLDAGPPERKIAPCEALKFIGETSNCKGCNLSYAVLILANRNGKTVVTGQGLQIRDGSILAIYYSIQFGTDFEVLFPCGVKKKVKCVTNLKKCSKNGLSDVYTVRLVLEDSCQKQDCSMTDDSFAEPKFQTCRNYSPISGCIVTSTNTSCISYGLTTVPAFLLNDLTGAGLSFAIPEDVSLLSIAMIGGLFISDDCKILGMIVNSPLVVLGTAHLIPLANQVNTFCILPVIPIECFYEEEQ